MHIAANIADKVQALKKLSLTTLATHLGLEITHYSQERVLGELKVRDEVKQPFGIMHGGTSVAIAETLASIGGWLNIDETKFLCVGIEINANHIRSVKEGTVYGEALPLHIGRSTQVWEVKLHDNQKRLVCVSRCTLAIVPQEF